MRARDRIEQVLGVVEHRQRRAVVAEPLDDLERERASRRLRHTERRPECVRDRVVVAVGGQLAPPHTTGEAVREPCCDLGRQS